MAYAPVPGTNTSGSNIQAQLAAFYLQRRALDTLRPNTIFRTVCMEDSIPKRNGKQITWFRYTNLAANTTPKAEGVVPTSSAMPAVKTVTATASQYADYITVSDVMRDVGGDDQMAAAADALGFSAALSVDNITRTVIDGEAGAEQTEQGTYLKVADFRAAAHILEGLNIQGFQNGLYEGIVHPYIAFDIVNDPAANGLADTYKYTDAEKTGLVRQEYHGTVCVAGGCRIRKSTNVKMTAGTPNQWRSYIFGKGGIGATAVVGYLPDKVTDPAKQNFVVKSRRLTDVELANPTGQIGGFVSYNFMWTVVILQGASPMNGPYRYRWIDTPSSIVS